MAHLLLPLSRAGFLLAISMGFLLFSADASHVVKNPAFQAKLLLIAAALVNIVIAHAGPGGRSKAGAPKRPAEPSSRRSCRFCCGSARSAPAVDSVFLMEDSMRRMRCAIIAIVLGFCSMVGSRRADEASQCLDCPARRRACCADAPCRCAGGVGDPPGFRVDDCATQRNLSAKGRADAEKIGSRLKREGICVRENPELAMVPMHRHGQVAEPGTVETEETFGNVVVLRDQRDRSPQAAARSSPNGRRAETCCRNPRREHFGADRHLAGQRRDRRRRKRERCGAEPVGRLLLD
jgi:hypothetical protein